MNKIYLDYNATTPTDPEVLDSILPYLKDSFGNPSSIHSFGSDAKAALDLAREKVSSYLGSRTSEIVFTTSGSESNNFAVKGVAFGNRNEGNHLITTKVEHASCLETFRYLESEGFKVSYIGVDKNGLIDPSEIEETITDDTTLISCMYVNNETGVISPVQEIAEIAKRKNVIFHTDAVQAVGKIDIDLGKLPVDLLSFSSHKIYGPKGVGALFIRKGTRLTSLIHGGGQERGKRSGTENVAGIVGMGKACELLTRERETGDEKSRIRKLRDNLHNGLLQLIDNIELNGDKENIVNNTLNLSFGGIHGESLVMNLDIEGIAVSTGSACSEGNVDPSHVLLAMGQDRDKAVSSLRFSIGRFTSEEDIERVLEIIPGVIERITKAKKTAVREI